MIGSDLEYLLHAWNKSCKTKVLKLKLRNYAESGLWLWSDQFSSGSDAYIKRFSFWGYFYIIVYCLNYKVSTHFLQISHVCYLWGLNNLSYGTAVPRATKKTPKKKHITDWFTFYLNHNEHKRSYLRIWKWES